MPASRTLTLDGLADYLRRTGRALASVDLGPYWRVARVLVEAETKQRFSTATAPDGTPWPPLKNPSRRRGGASAKPLRDTGLLFASVTSAAQVSQDAAEFTYGTNLFYAGWQNAGTGTIPAREFLGFNDRLASKLTRAFGDFLDRLLDQP